MYYRSRLLMLRTMLATLELEDFRLSEPNPDDEVAFSKVSSVPFVLDLESHPPDFEPDFLPLFVCRPDVMVVTVMPLSAYEGNMAGFPRPPPRPGRTTPGSSCGRSSYISPVDSALSAAGADEAVGVGFQAASRGSMVAESGADEEILGTVTFALDENNVADLALERLPAVALAEDVTSGVSRGFRLAVVSLPSPARYSSWEKKEELTELFDEKLVHDAYALVRGMMRPLPAIPSTTVRLASCSEPLRARGGGL